MFAAQSGTEIDGGGSRTEWAVTEGLGDTLHAEVFSSSSHSYFQAPNYAQLLPEAAAALCGFQGRVFHKTGIRNKEGSLFWCCFFLIFSSHFPKLFALIVALLPSSKM